MIQMGNNFEPTVKSNRNSNSDGFSQVLREAYNFFAENNIHMVSGIQEILAEQSLFNEYVNQLTKGLDPDEEAQLEQLYENARFHILQEASISNITPIVGLSMPVVRKMWLRTGMKNAMPTEVTKVPAFTIRYVRPYLRDADGKKHYIPEDLRNTDNGLAERKALSTDPIPVGEDFDLITENGGSLSANDSIDPVLSITHVIVDINGTDTEVKVDWKMSTHDKIYGELDKTVGGVVLKDILFGSVDRSTGIMSLASMKSVIKAVKIKGFFSTENNTRAQSVSFEVSPKDVRIGAGVHINAPLQIEWITDNLALYNIDGTVEVTEIMSNIIAQKLDQEMHSFMKNSWETHEPKFEGKFSVKPAAGFAGSPLDWRRELKTTIEHWATRLKSYSAAYQGHFVIYGNPLDVILLPDINWQFRSVEGEKGGVSVNYDIGAITGQNVYHVVAVENVPPGRLHMFFVPHQDNYMTYKYYPYSFHVQKDYIDPQHPLVPSIMMTKRHTIEELIPIQCTIEILHNDGSLITSYNL